MALKYPILNGMLLALGLGIVAQGPSLAAELDGFAINTQDKAVTVTLFTDERVSYSTEHQGKQFTIILPETQLSQEQIDNGLPVVLDNKNRFIGRAVPSGDGKVKIILPNLAANEYSVSIQQRHAKQATEKVATTNTGNPQKVKPRPAIAAEPGSQFEQVAANFPKPSPKKESVPSTQRLKLNPAPVRANSGQIWNPYVYRPSDFQPTVNNKPATTVIPKATTKPALTQNDPVSTVSVAESAQNRLAESQTGANADPLWYLHALPPGQLASNATDPLQGSALGVTTPQTTTSKSDQSQKAAPSALQELTTEIRKGFQALPQWLIITVAVFFGGIGLFSLIGGLVLLKVLFTQGRQSLENNPMAGNLPYMTGFVPVYPQTAGIQNEQPAEPLESATPEKSPHSSRPSYGQTSLKFEDKASIQTLNYLKETPSSVAQALHNTRIVRLQNRRRQGMLDFPKVSNR